jgi:hypothetical protein
MAVSVTPDGHPEPIYFRNLGISLRSRFEQLRELTDLENPLVPLKRPSPSLPMAIQINPYI